MKKRVVGLVCGFALAVSPGVFADDWPGPGKYVATDATSFVNPDDPSIPFTMGEGMLLYTGSTLLTDVTLTFNQSGHPETYAGVNTINVENPETTLTLAGKINHTQGCFYKDGPGTLALTYPGYQQLAPGPSGGDVKQTSDPVFDEETGACQCGYTTFTQADGIIIMGAPGQTNHVIGMTLIGNRKQAKVRLAVTNGVFRQANNWLCIARGTGQNSNDAEAELYVGPDARVECGELNIANSLDKPDPCPRGRVIIDGGSMSCSAHFFCNESGCGKSEFYVKNGGSFRSTHSGAENAGWRMQCGEGGVSTARVEQASQTSANYFSSRKGSVLIVNGGSKFLFSRTVPTDANLSENCESAGRVTFDGATLGLPYAYNGNWFSNMRVADCRFRANNFTVGANGLVLDVPKDGDSSLFPPIATASDATAADVKITKQGEGTASIVLPAKNQIDVKEGDLRLRNILPNTASVASQTPTVAAGSRLIAAGEEAFANLTIPAGTPVVLRSQGMELETGGNWACTGWAAMRSDGMIALGDAYSTASGSAFLRRTVDVSKSFRLTFDVASILRHTQNGGGISVCFSAQGPSIRGGQVDTDLGYRYGSFTNAGYASVALLVDLNAKCLRFGQDGLFSGATVPISRTESLAASTIETPHRAVVDYDAEAGTISLTMKFRNGTAKTISREVNLATALGASTAYLGFTGSTHANLATEYIISNVAFADKAAPVAMRAGGNVTASADAALAAEVVADAGDPAIMMKKLTYTDGAVLDIGSAAVGGKGEIGEFPSLANKSDWDIYGGAHWMEDGGIGLSTAVYDDKGGFTTKAGSAYSKKALAVDRDWTIDFDFAFGKMGGGVRADCVTLAFTSSKGDNSETVSEGFTIDCRYYLSGSIPAGHGTMSSTRLYFYKNGQAVRGDDFVYDCSPVRLYDSTKGHFTIAYAKAERRLTITVTDKYGDYTKELTDFDLKEMLDGSETAFLRFEGAVGGSWTENIVSNLKVATAADRTVAAGALGFDTWDGAGTVVKRGSGSLALVTNNAQNVSVKVEEGGLFLAKEYVNDYFDTGRGGWLRSDANVADGRRGGVRVGYYNPSQGDASAAHLARRLPFGRSWTFSGDLYGMCWATWGSGYGGMLADAITIFVHNHPNGVAYRGGSGIRGGFGSDSMKAGWALNFQTYSDSSQANYKKWCSMVGTQASAADWPGYDNSYKSSGFAFYHGQTTHFDIAYDAEAKKATFTMSGWGQSYSSTVENLDLKSILGGEYGWLGFGSGGGGAHGILDWTNVRVTFPDGTDAEADSDFLKDVEITAAQSPVVIDSRRANGVFRLAPAVKVAAGSALLAQSATLPSTLTMGTLTLGEGAVVGGDANTVVRPDALVCADSLKVEATTLALATKDSIEDVREIHLSGGAKLRLDYAGTALVRRVYVDGVRQKAGTFGADGKSVAWIDPASTGTLATGTGFYLIVK